MKINEEKNRKTIKIIWFAFLFYACLCGSLPLDLHSVFMNLSRAMRMWHARAQFNLRRTNRLQEYRTQVKLTSFRLC